MIGTHVETVGIAKGYFRWRSGGGKAKTKIGVFPKFKWVG